MRELFISYKRTDETKAFDIIQILEKQLGAYSCWIDTTGIESGEYFRDTIMSAIRNSSVVLFLMSKNSVISPSTAPTWVQKEVLYAIKKGKKVMPISIDGTKLDDCDWLLFECGELDFIDWNIHKQRQKLIDNLTNWKIVRDYNKDFKDQIQVETDGDKGGSKQDHNYSTENIGLIIWTVVSVISLICVYLAIYYRTNIALQYKAIFGLCAGITLILLMASLINPKILFFNKKKFVLLYLLPLLLFTSAVSSGIEETDTIPSSEMINDINVYWSVECTESQKETVRDILEIK